MKARNFFTVTASPYPTTVLPNVKVWDTVDIRRQIVEMGTITTV